MARSMARREAVLFGCLVLALAVLTRIPGLGWLFPFTPAIAAVVVIVLTRQVGPVDWMSLGLDRAGLRAWPAAVIIPAFALGTGLLVAWQLGWTQIRIPADMGVARWLLLALAAIVISTIGALGEEIGWRGWLLPRVARYGRIRAGLVVGLLWGTWHIPAIGFDPLFIVAVVILGFSVNELAFASRSVWPAAIFHGAHNALLGILGGLTFASTTDLGTVMGTTGRVAIACYALVALAIVVLRRPWAPGVPAFRDPPTIDRVPTPSLGR